MTLELYRGITVPPEKADDVVNSILTDGLNGAEGRWNFQVPADIASAQSLARKSLDDPAMFESVWTGSAAAGLCACGSRDGAAYYANEHNVVRAEGKTLPLLITLGTSLDKIYVDCRDFLMPALQGFDRVSSAHIEEQRASLKEFFGGAVLLYFDKCLETGNQQERIALGNMATFDQDVIRSHLLNSRFLAGRYNTRFKSAFFVSAPIAPSDILNVEALDLYSPPSGAYSLDDFSHGKPA